MIDNIGGADQRGNGGNPSQEPPVKVGSEIAWRVAIRLLCEHQAIGAGEEAPSCAGCGRPWPCSGRRLAELGLNEALR